MRKRRATTKPEPTANRFAVRPVGLETRALTTLDVTRANAAEVTVEEPGAIVRLRPSADVGREQVQDVARRLREAGAHVRVMPPEAGPAVVMQAEAAEPSRPVREVVEGLVAEANAGDRDALRALVVEVMDEEGV